MLEHRLTRSAALGLTIAALAAPAAVAKIHDETVVVSQTSAAATPIRDETVVLPAVQSTRPIRNETIVQSPHLAAALPSSHPSSSHATAGSDWTTGAVAIGALVLLAIAGVVAVARQRRTRLQGMGKLTT